MSDIHNQHTSLYKITHLHEGLSWRKQRCHCKSEKLGPQIKYKTRVSEVERTHRNEDVANKQGRGCCGPWSG